MALARSLEMDPTERADRMRRNLEYSQRLTTTNWATQVSVFLCAHDLLCLVCWGHVGVVDAMQFKSH